MLEGWLIFPLARAATDHVQVMHATTATLRQASSAPQRQHAVVLGICRASGCDLPVRAQTATLPLVDIFIDTTKDSCSSMNQLAHSLLARRFPASFVRCSSPRRCSDHGHTLSLPSSATFTAPLYDPHSLARGTKAADIRRGFGGILASSATSAGLPIYHIREERLTPRTLF